MEDLITVFLHECTISEYLHLIKTNPYPFGTGVKSVQVYHRPVSGDFIVVDDVRFMVHSVVIPRGPGILTFGEFEK